jgi:FkbM family methyltransferase
MFAQKFLDDQEYDACEAATLVTWSNFGGGLVLDIGASLGFFSKCIIDYYPQSRSIMVEPSKKNFQYLVNNSSDLNVLPIQAAITTGDTEVTFYENYDPSQGSIIMTDHLKVWEKSIKSNYKVKGLDFQKMMNILQPNLIKIDIEGYELFLDYSNLPSSVRTIVMEVHMETTDQFGNILPSVTADSLELYTKITKTLFDQGFEYIKHTQLEFPFNGSWNGTNQTHIVCFTKW